jgi:hypothetical protein
MAGILWEQWGKGKAVQPRRAVERRVEESAHPAVSTASEASTTTRSAAAVLQAQRVQGNRFVQRMVSLSRAGSMEGGELPEETTQQIDQARSGGRSLDGTTRKSMESAFDADFGGVRVHTGAAADRLNGELSARAFTTGSDIFFRQGEYDPSRSSGRELLAHELTHVVQQGGGGTVQGKLTVGPADHPAEHEADRTAAAVVARETASDEDRERG